jgi:hypothetical protein
MFLRIFVYTQHTYLYIYSILSVVGKFLFKVTALLYFSYWYK